MAECWADVYILSAHIYVIPARIKSNFMATFHLRLSDIEFPWKKEKGKRKAGGCA